MAPVFQMFRDSNYQSVQKNLQRRQDNGSHFSVILGCVTGTIIFSCILWAIIPHINKRFSRKPSRTKFNDGTILPPRNSRPVEQVIRNHPLPVKARTDHAVIYPPTPSDSPSETTLATLGVRTYNPRIETPFPNIPPRGDHVHLPAIYTPRVHTIAEPTPSTSSNGLFSPIGRKCKSVSQFQTSKHHTMPKGSDTQMAKHQTAPSADFGDAKSYILAVPEPLEVKSKQNLGCRELQSSTQRQIGSSQPSSLELANLPHPNKLFRALKVQWMRNSECSSTSLHVDHRASDAIIAATQAQAALRFRADAAEEESSVESLVCTDSDASLQLKHSTSGNFDHEGDTTRYHLESYRSLTGGPPAKLLRAGTVTRPKTPVQDMLKVFDGEVHDKDAALLWASQSSRDNASANYLFAPESSELGSISTPATSHQESYSNLQLLPTPLHVKHVMSSFESAPPISHDSHLRPKPKSITQLRAEAERNRARLKHLERILRRQSVWMSSNTNRRPRPAALNLKSSTRARTAGVGRKEAKRKSIAASIRHSLLIPVVKKSSSFRASIPASSIYSRDTQGLSMVRTPLSADFRASTARLYNEEVTVKYFCHEPQDGIAIRADAVEGEQEMHKLNGVKNSLLSEMKHSISLHENDNPNAF